MRTAGSLIAAMSASGSSGATRSRRSDPTTRNASPAALSVESV